VRPVVGNIFAFAKLFGSRDVDVMTNFVKKNISEQCVSDRRKFSGAWALRNDVINEQGDVSGPTLPRLCVSPKSFARTSGSAAPLTLLAALRTIQATSVR
jgi:hypothetical protein